MTATTTATAHVPGVRDIPRLCTCGWRMVYALRRPAGWRRAVTEPECPVHGTTGPALDPDILKAVAGP